VQQDVDAMIAVGEGVLADGDAICLGPSVLVKKNSGVNHIIAEDIIGNV
jgi:hypothetical protein